MAIGNDLIVAGYDPYLDGENFYYDPVEAEKPIRFCETYLSHVIAASGPLILSDFHKRIIRNIYGWYHKETKTRRYRSVFIFCPRKNAKSTIAAVIGLWELLFSKTNSPYVALGACDKDQAALIYDICEGFCLQNKALKKRVKLLPSRKRIICTENRGALWAMASDSASAHGLNLSTIVLDEISEYKSPEFANVLKTSQGSRTNRLLVQITTAGVFDDKSYGWQEYDYAKKVLSRSIVNARYLPVICEADPADDWRAIETHKKANPLYGISVESDYLTEECQKAIDQPMYENFFKQRHLNIWTAQESRFINLEDWDSCGKEAPDNMDELEWFGGLDLSNTLDLTSFSLVAKHNEGFIIQNWSWIPEQSATVRKARDKIPYTGSKDAWDKDPLANLEITDGRKIDYDEIAQRIMQICGRFNVDSIAYDRWNHTHTVKRLSEEGIKCVDWGQGYASMSQPTKDFSAYIIDQRINHLGNPLLRWAIENCAVKSDPAGNIKLVKPEYHKGQKKIDPAVASVMALGLCQVSKGTITVSL